jgi:hypothetical protein
MQCSEQITKVATALLAAQREMPSPRKTKDNPHFKSKYPDLEEVVDTATEVLNKHGLYVSQLPGTGTNGPTITTVVIHAESGQWIGSEPFEVPTVKKDAQTAVAAVTYGRRCSAMAFFFLAAEDDDGNSASARPKEQPAKTESAPAAPARHPQDPPKKEKKARVLPRNRKELDAWDDKVTKYVRQEQGELIKFLYGKIGDNLLRWEQEKFDALITEFVRLHKPPEDTNHNASDTQSSVPVRTAKPSEESPPCGDVDAMLDWISRVDDEASSNGYGPPRFFIKWMTEHLGDSIEKWTEPDIKRGIAKFDAERNPNAQRRSQPAA